MTAPLSLLLALTLLAVPAELKRARDRFEFGAYADCAGTLRQYLAGDPPLTDAQAVEAYRLLGISEFQLGDQAQSRAAFVNLLSFDPEFVLDAFLVPPPIVEFFDKVKKENESALAPLRERRRELREQQRLADEARRRLLTDEQARSGPPTKVILVQKHIYLFNWLPLGAGQFQNGQAAKGTAIAAGEIVAGLVNLGAIFYHTQLADDRSRLCTSSQPGCSQPPYTDADRSLFARIDAVKYTSAIVFWGLYAYGVWDAHHYFVPVVETEMGPNGLPSSATVGVKGAF